MCELFKLTTQIYSIKRHFAKVQYRIYIAENFCLVYVVVDNLRFGDLIIELFFWGSTYLNICFFVLCCGIKIEKRKLYCSYYKIARRESVQARFTIDNQAEINEI
jgi:hypothetical protein